MDLKAIATAIGGEGVGCVSVVQPYIDIKTLHRQLSASNNPGIRKVIDFPWCRAQAADAHHSCTYAGTTVGRLL